MCTSTDTRVKKEKRSNKANIFRPSNKFRVQYIRDRQQLLEEEIKGNQRTASHVGKKYMLPLYYSDA